MKELKVTDLIPIIKELALQANFNVSPDTMELLKASLHSEESEMAKEILSVIIDNHNKASKVKLPLCQDTGMVVVFLEIGQEIVFIDGDLYTAINEGVRQAYRDGFLRKSIVADPFGDRINTKDNTPVVIHTDIVPGDTLTITLAPKGGGAENMSRIAMLKPADGIEGIKKFIIETIEIAGGNSCPPVIVGIGIGGNFEQCALLAKKALMGDLRVKNQNLKLADLEDNLLKEINKLGIGPMGLGGRTTALGVKILSAPCHIASLPVAINIQCHASRHCSITL